MVLADVQNTLYHEALTATLRMWLTQPLTARALNADAIVP